MAFPKFEAAKSLSLSSTSTLFPLSLAEKELRSVRALMQLEQKEDLAQFKLKNAKASIQERQKPGVNAIRMGSPSRVSELLLKHTLDAHVMAHPSYSKMRLMRQTADQYRETASEHVRHFGFEERRQRHRLRFGAHLGHPNSGCSCPGVHDFPVC